MKLRLKVDLDGTTYTYEDDDLLTGEVELDEALRDRTIEMGSVDFAIPGSFLGANTYDQLPGEVGDAWRALLETTGGTEILNGIIYRDEVDFTDEGAVFGITLLAAAAKEFWERLEEVSMRLLGSSADSLLTEKFVGAFVKREAVAGNGDTRTYFDFVDAVWFELGSLCKAAIEEATNVQATIGALWEFSVRYDDGGGTKTITRAAEPYVTSPHLFEDRPTADPDQYMPNWTGRDVIEAAAALAGWRVVRASFNAFPSATINVEFITDDWTEETGLPNLDGLEAEPYTYYTVSPELEDFALAYENPIGEAGFESNPVNLDVAYGQYKPGAYRVAVPPPPHAVYAGRNWRIGPPEKRGETPRSADNDSVESLPLRLPNVLMDVSDKFGESGYNLERITPDSTNHPNYEEAILWGRPMVEDGVEAVYLTTFETVTATDPSPNPDFTGDFAIFARLPSPTLPADQRSPIHECWAPTILGNYSFSAQSRTGLDSRFDVRGLSLTVGVKSGGAEVAGLPRLVTSMSQNLTSGFAELTLQRPGSGVVTAALPAVTGAVLNLQGVFSPATTFLSSPSGSDFVALHWDPPAAKEAKVLFYEVEYDDPSSGWVNIGSFFATELMHPVDSADAPFDYRVRAVYGRLRDGVFGLDANGVWVETTVEV